MKKTLNILAIEDCLEDVEIYKQQLKKSKLFEYNLIHAQDVREAFEKLKANAIDCILLDNYLPGISGVEMLEKLSPSSVNVPIIMLTGSSNSELDIQAMENGAVDFIEKSDLTSKLLERSIRYAIERQKLNNGIKEFQQLQEEFFCNIFDKLKDPLKTMTSYCDQFFNQKDNAPSGPHLYDLIGYINNCAKEQITTINDMMKEQFLTMTNPRINFEEIDFSTLIQRCLKKIKKRIIVNEEFYKEGVLVNGDRVKLINAIVILIKQACYYEKKSTLNVILEKDQGTIKIIIIISNQRLSDEIMGEIFTPFSDPKGHPSFKNDQKNHKGINIAYAKRVIELHEGMITIEKQNEHQFHFVIQLPSNCSRDAVNLRDQKDQRDVRYTLVP